MHCSPLSVFVLWLISNADNVDGQAAIYGLDSPHLATGSPEPSPLPAGTVRLYGMRFCPFTHRAFLALRLKQIPFQVININTQRKPAWFWIVNPIGKVPVLEHDGKYVYESLVIVDYVNDAYTTGQDVLPRDPHQRASQKMMSQRLAGLGSSLSYFYHNRNDPTAIQDLSTAIGRYEALLNGPYFGGNSASYVDYMSWPWVERLSALPYLSHGPVSVTPQQYPKLAAYIERMKTLPEIRTFLLDGSKHAKFLESVLSGYVTYD